MRQATVRVEAEREDARVGRRKHVLAHAVVVVRHGQQHVDAAREQVIRGRQLGAQRVKLVEHPCLDGDGHAAAGTHDAVGGGGAGAERKGVCDAV